MASPPTIVHERGGFPVELLGEADWRRAIKRGQIARNTPVTVIRGTGAGHMLAADQVPELLAIFEELDPSPPAPEPPAPEPSAPEPSAPLPPAPNAEELLERSRPWPEAEAPEADWLPEWSAAPPASPASPQPVVIPGPMKAAGWLLALIVLLALIGRCDSTPTPANQAETTTNMAPMDQAGAQAVERAPATFETSFDCAAATLPAERVICASRELAAQDREVARRYAAAAEQLFGDARVALQEEQRQWLDRRNACGNELDPDACMSRLYVERIGTLQIQRSAPPPADSMSETARPPRNVADPRRPATLAPPPETVLCILPDGMEARISFEQCRARSGVVMSD